MMSTPFKFLRVATPYVRALRGKVFVVKIGGDLLTDPDRRLHIFDQLGLLHGLGINHVVVHGGGPQITEECERRGLPVEIVNGRRITSPEVLDAAIKVLAGSLQAAMLADMRRLGLPAAGASGIAAGLITARRRAPVEVTVEGKPAKIDYGLVGDIETVDTSLLKYLVDGGIIPLVAPLGCTTDGCVLNINADTAAARIASAMGAEKLIFLTRLPGILRDLTKEATLVPELDLVGLEQLESEGVLGGGMLPKVAAIRTAIDGGVASVHIVSGLSPDALLKEIFTNEGSGTMVKANA